MIRGTKRPMPKQQTLDFRASIHNRFDIEVLDAKTGELKQRAQAFNVICDALWDKLLNTNSAGYWTPQDYFAYILYGSGTGTPSASDTTLFTKIAAKLIGDSTADWQAITVTLDRVNSIASARASITIQAAESVGETITEVGIGYDDTHVVTHALLQDMNGNPISIEKTDTDVIKIYATVFLHWPAAAWYNGAVNLSEVSDNFNTFYRVLFGKTTYGNSVDQMFIRHAYMSIAGENSFSQSTGCTWSVNRAAKKITAAYRFQATDYNRPIRCIGIGNRLANMDSTAFTVLLGSWFTPPQITGEAVGTGDGTTADFATAFPVRSGATVKINGSAASGVTVRTGAPDGTMLHKWINPVLGFNTAGCLLYPPHAARYNDYYEVLLNNGEHSVFDNPFYSDGIGTISVWNYNSGVFQVRIDASDDMESWETAGTLSWNYEGSITKTVQVPVLLQTKKFFKLTYLASDYAPSQNRFDITASMPGEHPETNVHFDTPPAAGAVITIDYTPDCIAKDENHVFDLTLELTLSEYTEG